MVTQSRRLAVAAPSMASWNLALRFGLEIAALVGIGAAAWHLTDGISQWVAALIVPSIAAGVWATFNVADDPSRSGNAPIVIPGTARLALEVVVLAAGWTGYGITRHPLIGAGFAALTIVHYAASRARIRWLLNR